MNNSGFLFPERNIASRIYTSLDASQITQEESSDGINWKSWPLSNDGVRRRYQAPNCASGGGGLLASVEDFAMFLQMIANGGTLHGNRIRKEETVALMFETKPQRFYPKSTRAFVKTCPVT